MVYNHEFYDFTHKADEASIPFEDVAPVVHIGWKRLPMKMSDNNVFQIFKCSNCGYETETISNYCPECGGDAQDGDDALVILIPNV